MYGPTDRPGVFVEFGACDGLESSNTQVLEKYLGWSGLLAEPARIWHKALPLNRSAKIDWRAVWSDSGQLLSFWEAETPSLSTLKEFQNGDGLAPYRERGLAYQVITTSLWDLLVENSMPNHIDFLSIDTEGSEVNILEYFRFEDFSFGVIVCEHNNEPGRLEEIRAILGRNEYVELEELRDISGGDAWFVSTSRLAPK